MDKEDVRKTVRERYGSIVETKSSCCAPVTACCGGSNEDDVSKGLGYTDDELKDLPEGANLGLGCGNPVAMASLKEGDTVLDLGSGAGIDCFIASKQVGTSGNIIGVDMTPSMIEAARKNAEKAGIENVEFRLGEIEHLPVADGTVDVIISNCVINLSPEKEKVFKDSHRVLKPGGRLMISDIVLLRDLPETVRSSVDAYIGCVAGAVLKDEYLGMMENAGFKDVEVIDEQVFPVELVFNDPTIEDIIASTDLSLDDIKAVGDTIVSVKVSATK